MCVVFSGRNIQVLCGELPPSITTQTPNPKPQTPNPKPQTLNRNLPTLNLKPSNPKRQNLNPNLQTPGFDATPQAPNSKSLQTPSLPPNIPQIPLLRNLSAQLRPLWGVLETPKPLGPDVEFALNSPNPKPLTPAHPGERGVTIG